MGSFVRTMQRKQARKMAKEEEETQDGEETEEGEAAEEPLSDEEAEAMLIDAEVLIRAGAEKIDALVTAGYLKAQVRDGVDAVWNALLAKIEEQES